MVSSKKRAPTSPKSLMQDLDAHSTISEDQGKTIHTDLVVNPNIVQMNLMNHKNSKISLSYLIISYRSFSASNLNSYLMMMRPNQDRLPIVHFKVRTKKKLIYTTWTKHRRVSPPPGSLTIWELTTTMVTSDLWMNLRKRTSSMSYWRKFFASHNQD